MPLFPMEFYVIKTETLKRQGSCIKNMPSLFMAPAQWHLPLLEHPGHPQPHPGLPALISRTFFPATATNAIKIPMPIIQSTIRKPPFS